VSLEVIDSAALREYLRPGGPWATECGQRVRKYRHQLGEKHTETWLGAAVGKSAQTIRMVEAGQIVPRDYLRAAIAFALGKDSEIIWPPIPLTRVREIGQVE